MSPLMGSGLVTLLRGSAETPSLSQKQNLMMHCVCCSSNKIMSGQTNSCDIKEYTLKGMFSQCLMKGREAAPQPQRDLLQHQAKCVPPKLPVAPGQSWHSPHGICLPDAGASPLPSRHAAPAPRDSPISWPLPMLLPWPEFPFLPFLGGEVTCSRKP